MKRLMPQDDADFLHKLADGRVVSVYACGRYLPSEYYTGPGVQNLYIEVIYYSDADDCDGVELNQSDLPHSEWEEIEDIAVNRLCEEAV